LVNLIWVTQRKGPYNHVKRARVVLKLLQL
jgi:hypothetical protein